MGSPELGKAMKIQTHLQAGEYVAVGVSTGGGNGHDVSGAGLVAHLRQVQQTTLGPLADEVVARYKSEQARAAPVVRQVGEKLAVLDDYWQRLLQEHIVPLPIGRQRSQQTAELNLDLTTFAADVKDIAIDLIQETRVGRQGQTLFKAVSAQVAALDDRYQHWIHDHIDPLFGQERQQQQRELSAGRKVELSPAQKQANYSLALGVTGLGLAAFAHLVAIPVVLVSAALGLYIMTPMIKLAYRQAVDERKLSILHLGLVYLACMYLGGFLVIGAMGIILLAFANKIELLSEAASRDELTNIFGQQARFVWMVVDGVEIQAPIERVKVGDIVVIDAGQMIPVDGVVVEGVALVDQHMLTGESQPTEKQPAEQVLAATIVLSGRLFVRVEKTGAETTANQIREILNRTTRHRLSIQEKATQLADRSLKPMLVGSGLGLVVGGPVSAIAILGSNFTLTMLGLAPLTMLNALNQSSRSGILVKEGDALEKLRTVDTVLFDKTGTLTVEQPTVVQIHTCNGFCEADVLQLAAAAEHRQNHPMAQAILAAAVEHGLAVLKIEDAHYEVGYGIKVRVMTSAWRALNASHDSPLAARWHALDAFVVRVGSWRFMKLEELAIPPDLQAVQAACQAQAHSLVFVAVEDEVIGALELKATVRAETRQVVEELRRQGMKLYIISGDHEAPTRSLAHELGMDGYFADTLPEHKADLVAQLQTEGHKVCFVGDGINDAIALKKADVSISLAGATTAATDTAQVVLMDADLRQLLTLIQLVDGLHKNLDLNLNALMALSALAAGSILVLNAGFVAVEILNAASVIFGLGIATRPLLEQPNK
jgi:Cu2+-exporting ATPase